MFSVGKNTRFFCYSFYFPGMLILNLLVQVVHLATSLNQALRLCKSQWDNGKLYRLVKTACQTLYSWISIDSKCTLYKVSEKMSLREDVMWILSRLLSFLSNCFFFVFLFLGTYVGHQNWKCADKLKFNQLFSFILGICYFCGWRLGI